MRKLLLMGLPLLFVNASFSQITIVSTDFADIGDQYIYYTDTNGNVNLGTPGYGVNWDFSALVPHIADTVNAVDPATTPDAADFPGANLAVSQAGGYAYLNKTGTGVTMLGFAGSLMGFGNGSVKFNPTSTLMQFPSTMATTFNSVSGFRSPAVPLGFSIPCGLSTVTIDSARIHHHSNATVNFDATGVLNVPTGQYNTVRSHTMDKTIDSLFVHTDGPCVLLQLSAGWQLAPNALVQLAGYQSNPVLDTIYTYNWYAKDEVNAVCSVGLDDSGMPAYAEYNASAPFSVENLDDQVFRIYPNPGTEVVYVDVEDISGFYYNIYDLGGKLCQGANMNVSHAIDLSGLIAGHYILKLEKSGKLYGTVHLQKN